MGWLGFKLLRFRKRYIFVFAAFLFGMFVLAWFHRAEIFTNKAFLFWISTFSGNWSASSNTDVNEDWFAISVVIAIVLNIGTIVGLLSLLLKILVTVERIQPMEITSAFMLRDRSIKEAIYNSFGDRLNEAMIESIETAFKEGTKIWAEQQIPEILGPEEAGRLINRIKDQGFLPK